MFYAWMFVNIVETFGSNREVPWPTKRYVIAMRDRKDGSGFEIGRFHMISFIGD